MNEISAVDSADDDGHPPRVPTPSSSNAGTSVGKMKEKKPIKRLDSEFGLDENEEEKSVIVSPKSSMISSRLAEPETADAWATKMIEFSSRF